jgi:hypothetical protein
MFLLAPAIATTMNLVCPGVWTGTTSSSDLVWNNQGGGYVNAWVDHTSASEAEVRVELRGTDGRLLISRGKNSKWWPLSEISPDGGRIQARMRFNLVDHPHVIIDPSAGRIRINALNAYFLGVCRSGSGDALQGSDSGALSR